MTVKITKPALNLREELASLRNQGSAYEESKFYLDGLVTNGDFSNGTTGWASPTAALSVVSNALRVTLSSSGNYAYTSITTVVGQEYVITTESMGTGTATSYRTLVGTSFGSGNLYTQATTPLGGDASFTITATATTTYISLQIFGTGYADFGNVSVYEVAPNLVTNGTFDSDTSGWTTAGSGVGTWSVSSGRASQSGQTGFSSYLNQAISCVVGETYTLSFEVYSQGNGNANIGIGTTGTGVSVNVWQDGDGTGIFSGTFTATQTTHYVVIQEGTASVPHVLDNIIVTQGNHHAIHSTPYGYEVKDVYIDGDLAR